ncbi:four-carbon acid sugar kinase family protein [Amaricoccus sp. W119]|uniref:four-carbon acid sugar kinase family protein n=1 Tax=Amaricoccus sp. W119 TaxID=3391833 RepID=UPI0039A5D38C
MRVLIVADDLTGALDSAVTLAQAGLDCVVARRPADVPEALALRPEVLSISTASRESTAEAARAAVAAALDAVGTLPPIVFKKVDSRLKGHVAEEAATLAARTGRTRALVSSAIPAQGRVVTGGQLTGVGVATPIDVAAVMAASGLDLDVPEARDDGDLDVALERAGTEAPLLLVGAAGLAAALGRRLAPSLAPGLAPGLAQNAAPRGEPELEGPILLAIGSHDAITQAQVDLIANRADVDFALAPDGVCPAPAAGAGDVGARVVRLVPADGRAFDPQAAGGRFAAGIAQLVRDGHFRTLLGCGGETADAILGALGAGVFSVEGEILPGVPVSTMLVGKRRLRLVTKSGGFGNEATLARVVDAAVQAGDDTR